MTLLKVFVGIVSTNVAAATQQPETTRGYLPMTGMWGILSGNYQRNLRPVKKALVVVDPQWCKFDHTGRAQEDVFWINFMNRLIKDFQWNDIFFTMETCQREHIGFFENLRSVDSSQGVQLKYDEETGAICEDEVDPAQVPNVFTSACQGQTMEIPQYVRSIEGACAIGNKVGDNQATGFLPSVLVPHNAAVLKRNTRAHVGSQNIFEDSFTETRREGGKPVELTKQSTGLEFFANIAETSQLFFVGSDPTLIYHAALEARRRGFKSVLLNDAIQRSYYNQTVNFQMRRHLHDNDVQVRQYIADWQALGESYFANHRERYDMLATMAYSRFGFEFAMTPEEFSPVEDSYYPVLWIAVGILIGGVIAGCLVAAYYMKRVNPKVAEEKHQEGIVRTRSGE